MNAPESRHAVDLPIEGMTCAACAARIEKQLNKLPGVSAAVNFAAGTVTGVLTAGGGNYAFPGLAPGNYIVRVDQVNFGAGGALAASLSLAARAPYPDEPVRLILPFSPGGEAATGARPRPGDR